MITTCRHRKGRQVQEILGLLNIVSNCRTSAHLWQPQGDRVGFKIRNKFLIGMPGHEMSFLKKKYLSFYYGRSMLSWNTQQGESQQTFLQIAGVSYSGGTKLLSDLGSHCSARGKLDCSQGDQLGGSCYCQGEMKLGSCLRLSTCRRVQNISIFPNPL